MLPVSLHRSNSCLWAKLGTVLMGLTAGVATEVELGRLEGGEAGLRQIEGTIFTDPTKAETFLKEYVL